MIQSLQIKWDGTMNAKWLVAGALLTAVLTGCATANVDKGFSFDKNKGMGLLVGSLTTTDAGNFFSQDINIYFTPTGDQKTLRSKITTNDQCNLGKSGKNDFKDYCGKLFVIALPPGDYALDSWNIIDAGGGVILPQHWRPVTVTIQAGKVTYVGNIHMVFDPTIPGSGPDGWHGWPIATDRHERDIPLLLSRYPSLRQDDVVMSPLSLDPPSSVCNSGNAGVVTFTNCGG